MKKLIYLIPILFIISIVLMILPNSVKYYALENDIYVLYRYNYLSKDLFTYKALGYIFIFVLSIISLILVIISLFNKKVFKVFAFVDVLTIIFSLIQLLSLNINMTINNFFVCLISIITYVLYRFTTYQQPVALQKGPLDTNFNMKD